jgi:hypothetical protein
MADQLKLLQAQRNKLWAEARLKGLARDTPERERIAELDEQIRVRVEAKRAKGTKPAAKATSPS